MQYKVDRLERVQEQIGKDLAHMGTDLGVLMNVVTEEGNNFIQLGSRLEDRFNVEIIKQETSVGKMKEYSKGHMGVLRQKC